MSGTGVKIGHGTIVRIGRGETPTWTKLVGVGDISFPEAVSDEIETTHMESPNGEKEYIGGLTDNGEMTIPLHWVPTSESDVCLSEIRASREIVILEVTTPDAAPEQYACFCKAYKRTAPVNDKRQAEATFRISGRVVAEV